MTGFGRASLASEKVRVSIEMKSVNSRFLEMRPKMPRVLFFWESQLREIISSRLKRGMVDVNIAIHSLQADMENILQENIAAAYAIGIEKLAKKINIESGLNIVSLLRLPGVLSADENSPITVDEKEVSPILEKCLLEVLDQLVEMRSNEGAKLLEALERELNSFQQCHKQVHEMREELNQAYFQKLKNRLDKFLSTGVARVDEPRLLQEVSFYLDRSDVTEELDRLQSHLKQMFQVIHGKEEFPVGKRMDFLVQEMGREVNTIGAKSDDIKITQHVMQMKLHLERIREQVQNLE